MEEGRTREAVATGWQADENRPRAPMMPGLVHISGRGSEELYRGTEPEMTTEERLEKLEREQAAVKRLGRRLLIVFGLFAGTVALAWIFSNPTRTSFAPADGKVIRANGFVLEDDQGRTRAALGFSEDGPSLALSDEKGKPRAGLAMAKDGPGLALLDEKGEIRAVLTVLKDGPSLGLLDENGKSRVGLSATKSRARAALGLSDEKGEIRAVLAAAKDGPMLGLSD